MGQARHLKHSTAILLVSCIFAAPCSSAYAQELSRQKTKRVTAQDAAPTQLSTIVINGAADAATNRYQPVETSTATRTNTPLLDIPQAVNVVSQEVLQDQHATSLDEALANISGISQANTLGGTQDSIIRRGFGDNRDGSILINGMKTALNRSFNATTDRVEVLKGPSSTLYGILDPGGMINVVTKKPENTFSADI